MEYTHTLMKSSRLARWAVLAWALGGCVGSIGERAGATPGPDATAAREGGAGTDTGAGSDAAVAPSVTDPGRVTLHRLNRAEYNNTVRDLLGTARRPADEFPADDRGYGYDNIADVLTASPVLLELYQRAAEALADEALAVPVTTPGRWMVEAETLRGTVGAVAGGAWNLWSNGDLPAEVTLPAAGRYRVTVRAWQQRGGPDNARMQLQLDGMGVRTVEVPNVAASPGEFAFEVSVARAGRVTLTVSFLNDFYEPMAMMDRNLYVDWLRVEGPLDLAGRTNPARARIVVCDPAALGEEPCARAILTRLGRRAWRRPLTEAEVTGLVGFLAVARRHGEGFEAGLRLAVQALLLSPHFVFRVELDGDPRSPEAHALSAHELAARLSYFLWSSMPDEALDALADDGSLLREEVLAREVERMLRDPRASALTENFAGQWLFTRALADHDVDAARFPRFNAMVRQALRRETEALFTHFLREDVSMEAFLTADFTFVDDALAGYYGLPTGGGSTPRRVPLTGTNRAGVLSHGSVLTVTSHPARTSPVLRGQWILTQLLCAPTPPPPPGVEGLPMEVMPSGSLRQRLEAHRARPECAACHARLDPLGFGLENFDAVGLWRTTDQGFPVDSVGTLPDGTTFRTPSELGGVLARDPRYARCVTRQVLTYALGRGMEPSDDDTLDQLSGRWTTTGLRLRDLVRAVVLSDAFRKRRGEPEGAMR